VDVDPETPLLWVLRDHLGLTGTKFGCGLAQCGSCTVHLDGEAIRSCATTAGEAAGKRVTTIEGLSTDRSHPLQQAWIAEDVPQCGYCQSGQIMAAAALLASTPRPTDADIDGAMAEHLPLERIPHRTPFTGRPVRGRDHGPARRPFRREFRRPGPPEGGLVLGVALPAGRCRRPCRTPGSDRRRRLRHVLCARSRWAGRHRAATLVAGGPVDLGRIKVEIAPVGDPYVNSVLGAQLTGGSTSVIDGYDKLRLAGAQARTMLVAAAAQRWGVDPAACHADGGAVLGPNGARATYGEVAEAASKLPVPENPRLKEHRASRYVGKAINRLDSAGKIDGSAQFGIDVRLPGMLYAALAQCPVIPGARS
jgi:aerobic-type carbon monoxide dehydrogenase small subunit (CoxS/CutS family)